MNQNTVSRDGICRHAGVVCRADCPWCTIDEMRSQKAALESEVTNLKAKLKEAENWENRNGD
jgi:hypothetical protein